MGNGTASVVRKKGKEVMALSVILKFAGSILCGLLLCSGLLVDFFRLHRENKRLEKRISLQKENMQKEK